MLRMFMNPETGTAAEFLTCDKKKQPHRNGNLQAK